MHDLYTATVRVDLPPDSEMSRGVESSIKSLPSSFECKALYVSVLHSFIIHCRSPLLFQFNSQQHESLTSPHLPKAKRLAHIVSGPQGLFSEGNRHVLSVHDVTDADIPLPELTSGRLFIVSVPFPIFSTVLQCISRVRVLIKPRALDCTFLGTSCPLWNVARSTWRKHIMHRYIVIPTDWWVRNGQVAGASLGNECSVSPF